MIEVEQKFRPTEGELAALLKDAQFVKEVVNHDVYYDWPDYRLYKNYVYFRNRNGEFELKSDDDEVAGVSEEVENDEDIKKFFNTIKPLPEFIKENLIPVIEWNTTRKKYMKNEFTIDIDSLDFGYECVEIELLVQDFLQVEPAKQKIFELAKQYKFNMEKVPAKRREYFRLVKPEIYKELYGHS